MWSLSLSLNRWQSKQHSGCVLMLVYSASPMTSTRFRRGGLEQYQSSSMFQLNVWPTLHMPTVVQKSEVRLHCTSKLKWHTSYWCYINDTKCRFPQYIIGYNNNNLMVKYNIPTFQQRILKFDLSLIYLVRYQGKLHFVLSIATLRWVRSCSCSCVTFRFHAAHSAHSDRG